MKEKFLSSKKYYNFSTECKCGLLVDEKTMKKVLKVLYKAEAEIKSILHNSEDVRPYAWGMVYLHEDDNENKITKSCYYRYPEYHPFYSVKERIDNLKLTTPEYCENFYEIHSEEEESYLKKCLLEELKEEL